MWSSGYLIDAEHGRINNRSIMKTRIPLALMAFVSAGLAFADTLSSYPDSLPKVSCDQFHYGDAFLHRYPMAPAACQEVKVADGERWAKFAAKVYLVELPDFVAFEIPDLEGLTTTINIKPRSTATIYVHAKRVLFRDLQLGDEVTFWMREQRLEPRALPTTTEEAWRVLPPLQ